MPCSKSLGYVISENCVLIQTDTLRVLPRMLLPVKYTCKKSVYPFKTIQSREEGIEKS